MLIENQHQEFEDELKQIPKLQDREWNILFDLLDLWHERCVNPRFGKGSDAHISDWGYLLGFRTREPEYCKLCFIEHDKQFSHKQILLHHISYYPIETIELCKSCHFLINDPILTPTYIKYTHEEYLHFYKRKDTLINYM